MLARPVSRLWFAACLLFSFSLQAAAENYTDRPEVITFIDDIAARNELDKIWATDNLAQAKFQSTVIRAILPGTKKTRSWQRYRDIMVNETKIRQGLQFWRENRSALARAEKETGIPAKIIVAIIGVETSYGRIMGNYRLIDALTTLAFDYPRRADFFKQELEAFLLLCREQGWDPTTIKGSYAGAIGLPQFMPSSYRQYAVDFDGDGRIRLFDSPADVIGSVANYLKAKGWQPKTPIAAPVQFGRPLPDTENWQAPTIVPNLTTETIKSFEPVWPQGSPTLPFALIPLETPDQPTLYWVGFQNFYVITRYNQSSFYAMSVFHLGEILAERIEQDDGASARKAPCAGRDWC